MQGHLPLQRKDTLKEYQLFSKVRALQRKFIFEFKYFLEQRECIK